MLFRSLNDLAATKKESGDWDGAEADYHEALRIARKVGYREGVAYMTGNLAELYLARENWIAAERLAHEAMVLAEGIGRLELIASNHHRLSEALLHQQRASVALPHAQQAVAIRTQLRHRDLAEAEATLAACEAASPGG